MRGTFYVVSTPISNLEDITLRAIRILREADIIICEDTRRTGILLQKLEISRKAKLISFYEENELIRIPEIITYLKNGKNVALVSSAGTPAISDPGFKIIRECVQQNIRIVPIPGPSAVLAALVASGFPTDKFFFLGYLPQKISKRKKLLENCKKLPFICTLVLFESPRRVIKLLKEIEVIFGNIEVFLARELTKVFETFSRGHIKEIVDILEKKPLRGEITVVFRSSGA